MASVSATDWLRQPISIRYGYENGYGNGDGSGDGKGYGDGSGDGIGYGNGNGNGYGIGYGYGARSGFGNGNGNGYGYGIGYGYGFGDGNGNGNGNGHGYGIGYGVLGKINGDAVYVVDGVLTAITRVVGNVAKGYIIRDDLTTTPCVVVNGNGYFAHGETIKAAEKALREKIFDNLDEEEKIDAFLTEFNLTEKYPAKMFYEWHHRLTGSCEMGRNEFVRRVGADLEHDTYTVREFLELTKNEYGGKIINEIIKRIEDI